MFSCVNSRLWIQTAVLYRESKLSGSTKEQIHRNGTGHKEEKLTANIRQEQRDNSWDAQLDQIDTKDETRTERNTKENYLNTT